MNELNDVLAKEFEDRNYAHAYIQAHVLDRLAMQVHALRSQRDWSQTKLAECSGIGQGKISKIERGEFESLNLKTLFKLAEAFDVAPVVQFQHFCSAIDDVTEMSQDDLKVTSRPEDLLARKHVRHLFNNPLFQPQLVQRHITDRPLVASGTSSTSSQPPAITGIQFDTTP